MVNASLFATQGPKRTDTTNQAGGAAYGMAPRDALAQYAMTGCLSATFYADEQMQLDAILALSKQVEPEYIAKLAVLARERGHMKDAPALLCAILATRDVKLLGQVFHRVLDRPKMLRNFITIIRSGAVGRKSFGTAVKRYIRQWIESRTPEQLLTGSVGSPGWGDIIKMVHPKPRTSDEAAVYGYWVNGGSKKVVEGAEQQFALPAIYRQWETFKAGSWASAPGTALMPDLPFELLSSQQLTPAGWEQVAHNCSWQVARQNLNTFQRHGVMNDKVIGMLAQKFLDEAAIKRAKVMPYQLLATVIATQSWLPKLLLDALQGALTIATKNVPVFPENTYIFMDCSGSMRSPVTGKQGNRKPSQVHCITAAGLMAMVIKEAQPKATIVAFADTFATINPSNLNTLWGNMVALTTVQLGGGTNCSAPMIGLAGTAKPVDLVIYLSDNESWMDSGNRGRGTGTMQAWDSIKRRNPNAKLVCVDLAPNQTTQAYSRPDILNIGGFSDYVFELIGLFQKDELGSDFWARRVAEVVLV